MALLRRPSINSSVRLDPNMNRYTEEIVEAFQSIQDDICGQLELFDGKGIFKEDLWERREGGGGRTRILSDGNVIEKGGVNFSAVHGPISAQLANALKVDPGHFFASGVSIVLHPCNPHVPIIHMNIRYFETSSPDSSKVPVWWFGGGIDLTPHYIIEEDARYFHRQLKAICDRHHHSFYNEFKLWADDYFYIKHREETRGIGGIFFDKLDHKRELNKDQLFDFVCDVGRGFAPIYKEIAGRHKHKSFTDQEKQWQLLRRGRYVEFNLVYDRGTKFGLETGGRIESILMSLPEYARWTYDFKPEENSREAQTLDLLKKGIDWHH